MHPSREELSAYLLGTLPEEESEAVSQHLVECPSCEATAEKLEAMSDTVVEKLRGGVPDDQFAGEAACQDMVSVIRAIGKEPSVDSAQVNVAVATKEEPNLGSVREYQLLTKLGQGGTGAVYNALHTKLQRVVALKMLPSERMEDAAAMSRFEREMAAVGQMMGTLDYMAPEQGIDTHNVDIRADIYALGATLFRLLTGRPPFSGERYNTAVKMIIALANEQAPSIATLRDDLPAELVAVVDRTLAKKPDDRFAEPQEVAAALTPFCEGCDLTRLLEIATAEDAETAEDESKVATHESLKSNSVKTAPTIDVPVGSSGSPLPVQILSLFRPNLKR
jgi:serine/threonine protein kinase